MSPWVVLGPSPLAAGLAARLAAHGPTTLVAESPVAGPFLWRRGSVATGEGVPTALKAAPRLCVVLDEPTSIAGLLGVVRPGLVTRGVVVLAHDDDQPDLIQRLDGLSMLRVGPVWGPHEPLVADWTRRIAEGRRVWVPDPGPIRPLQLVDVVAAVLAAADRPGRRWILGAARELRLADLAAGIGTALGRPARTATAPLSLAAWASAVPAARLRRWVTCPNPPSDTAGWSPPPPAPDAAWVGDTPASASR